MEFINTQISQYPELVDDYTKLGNYHEKRLWHQLSIALEAFITNPKNIKNDNIIQLYENFIITFESRLNQIKLAGLISHISKTLQDPTKILNFLTKILVNRDRLGKEAAMCLDMDVLMVKIQLGDEATAKSMLESATENLPSINTSESYIFSKFYKASAEYKKIVGPANEFYSAALMFLSYTPMEDLHSDEKYTLATDMALASITGDGIYNFGEVLATPILISLQNTANEWLLLLVEAMNSGNVNKFNSILDTYKQQYFAQPALVNAHDKVKEKILLLGILELAFERSAHDRLISFKDISSRISIEDTQVEWILMRAMSLGIIKGLIDEVEETINITCIQPRVLDKNQISLLNEQLQTWTEKVKQSLITIEDQAVELYV